MTPQQFIEYLLTVSKNLDLDKPIVFGYSFERSYPFDPDFFEIRDGQLFLNTYEGM